MKYSAFLIILLLNACNFTGDKLVNHSSEEAKSSDNLAAHPEYTVTGDLVDIRDSTRVANTTVPCSDSGFGKINDCFNQFAPPVPSINKTIQPNGSYSKNTTKIPNERVSSDGRLLLDTTLSGNKYLVSLSLFRPEAIKYDFKKNSVAVKSLKTLLHPIVLQNPLTSLLDYQNKESSIHNFHVDVCHDTRNDTGPRICYSQETLNGAVQTIKGECYDITLFTKLERVDDHLNWEIRSVAVTVFIKNPKTINEQIFVLARNFNSSVDSIDHVKSALTQWGDPSKLLPVATQCSNTSNRPYYCKFVDAQKYATSATFQKPSSSSAPAYHPTEATSRKRQPFFEPTISGDGKLLIFNGNSIYYSYSTTPCDASKWNTYNYLSQMYYTPLKNIYDLAKYPLRNSQGDMMAAGEPFPGAYPWMDKKARNIIFTPVNDSRDHYLSNNVPIDILPGLQTSVVGSWTQGKVVVLDNMLNMSDFGGTGLNAKPAKFYSGENQRTIRPKGSRLIGSVENHLNYFDAMMPTSPFDVVWNVSSDTEFNSEVVFDEYLLNNAYVVAHMNAPLTYFVDPNGENAPFPDDGFTPQFPAYLKNVRYEFNNPAKLPFFQYSRNAYLQNSSTALPAYSASALRVPRKLKIVGGARVEPLAMGGVIGKGLYLDGINDFVEVPTQYDAYNKNWYIGLWLDSRSDDLTARKRIFQFDDDSWIELSLKEIQLFDNTSKTSKIIDIKNLGLAPGKFFHFAVKVLRFGSKTNIHFIINGTNFNFVENNVTSNAVSFNGNSFQLYSSQRTSQHKFIIGGYQPNKSQTNIKPGGPFQGWVDEFRIYNIDVPVANRPDHFSEFACNLAMGSNIGVYSNDYSSSALYPLLNIAKKHNLAQAGKMIVCEQLKLESHSNNSMFADQYGKTICAANTHRNKNFQYSERCERSKIYELENRKLIAQQPRPDFSAVPFCLSCHNDSALVNGLKLNALRKNDYFERSADPRRQPMDVPQKIKSCLPNLPQFAARPDRCKEGGHLADYIFDFSAKIKPSN